MSERDQHFTNPPIEGMHLHSADLAHLKVLIDAAVPREHGGPMDWEGTGRRYAESLIGFRAPCICPDVPGPKGDPGCPVHDPSGGAS